MPSAPSDFGLPDRFGTWRPNQFAISKKIAYGKERFYALNAPTGTGKSVGYMAPFGMMDDDLRMCVVTSQTIMQNQLTGDFPYLYSVTGQKHHDCRELPGLSCAHGIPAHCSYSGTRMCPWKAQQMTMYRTDQVTPNYAAYLTYGSQMGWFDYLVLDEFHDAVDHLTNHVRISLSNRYILRELGANFLVEDADIGQWRAWAANRQPAANECVTRAKMRAERNFEAMQDVMHAVDGQRALQSLMQSTGEWVWEFTERGITFEPVDVAQFGPLLYRKTPRIVLSSATMSRKTLTMTGVDLDDTHWIDVPSVFDPELFRITFAPVMRPRKLKDGRIKEMPVKWTAKSTPDDIGLILDRVVDIVGARLDVRGVIHSVSYDRAQYIALRLIKEFGSKLNVYAPSRENVKFDLAQFTNGPANAVFIAPSITTGWDGADDKCRYQVIPKMPWPDTRGAILKRRCEIDDQLQAYLCMNDLVQMLGRGNRSEYDWCENFIIDGSFEWFWRVYQDVCAPKWFPQYVTVSKSRGWNKRFRPAA